MQELVNKTTPLSLSLPRYIKHLFIFEELFENHTLENWWKRSAFFLKGNIKIIGQGRNHYYAHGGTQKAETACKNAFIYHSVGFFITSYQHYNTS